ncbi:MAG: hypothetical protein ABIO55_16470 [Ginsengibacter sp.]
MEKKLQHDEMGKTLIHQLSKCNLPKTRLSSISKSIAALHRTGFQVIDWSIFGKPAFERFVIDTQLPFDKVSSIQDLFVHDTFKEIFIFKKGLPPMPNFYNVKFTIENV